MANTRISEIKKVRRVIPCGNANEIFLAWVNSRGGIDSYLFEAQHAVTRVSRVSVTLMKYVEDFKNGEAFISTLKKDGYTELALIAPQVDQQTRNGLEELYTSPKVKMLLNGLNQAWDSATVGPKWQEVTVLDGRDDMGDTDDDVFDFRLRIELQPKQTLWS